MDCVSLQKGRSSNPQGYSMYIFLKYSGMVGIGMRSWQASVSRVEAKRYCQGYSSDYACLAKSVYK